MRSRDLVAALAGAAVVLVLAGGVAWAAIPDASGVIHGCFKSNNGQLRVAESAAACNPSETPIDWNQQGAQGPPGADGVSPTVTQLSVGDANCPAGGAAITDAAGTTAYVCSGQNGQDGADGDPFSGTFTSPNGEYTISVTDAGVTLSHGPNVHIKLDGDDIFVRGMDVELRADGNATVKAGINAVLEGVLSATVKGLNTTIDAGSIGKVHGAFVRIEGGGACLPAARVGDQVVAPGGAGQIVSGAPTVCVG